MKKNRHITKSIPIYGVRLHVIITNCKPKFLKKIPCTNEKTIFDMVESDEYACTIFHEEFSDIFVVLNPYNRKVKVGTIAHEAMHVVDAVHKRIGAYHDEANPEPTTYLLGWVTDFIYKELKRK